VVGVTNFAYVKVKNRGTQTATNVVVKAFHANPAAGLVYPNDWQPMNTAQLSAPNVAANNTAEITVGPFEWVPSQVGHECMFMVVSATGDQSNISNMTAGDSIPEWRLVPNDNNIGQRNVFPVAGGDGLNGLVNTFANPGAGAFKLNAGEQKEVVVRLKTGEDFTVEDVKKAKDAVIHIEAFANGIPVGGMSYQLDPELKGPTA
jgi:zinc metalloprotease ZmpB